LSNNLAVNVFGTSAIAQVFPSIGIVDTNSEKP